jgi:hypothetical protein
MTIEQTVDVPQSRIVQLPPDFPVGKAKVLSVRQMPFRKGDTAFDYDTWEKAAALAAADYQNDPELTAFSALDGEDFHETR